MWEAPRMLPGYINEISNNFDATISPDGKMLILTHKFSENNNDLYLQNGYAIGFGSVQRSRTVMCNKVYLTREFQVMLFRTVAATEQDGAAIKTSSKAVLEDEIKIIKAVENDPDLGGYAINAAFSDGDSLQYLEGDRGRYWQLITAFSVEYAENLT